MAKVKNKKKAFKHRLKKQGLFNNLKAPVPPVPPVAPQPFAESKTVAKEEVVTTDLSLESFAELPEVDGLRSNLVETLYNEGLTSVAAFATVTEEEVLALKGVGPATVKKLKENGGEEKILRETGKVIAPHNNGLILKWCMENVPEVKEAIEKETALYGTMDTWLIWKLTEGKTHAVACSNASSSGCVNVQKGVWNEEFIQNLGVPLKLFPTIASEASEYGVTKVFGKEIPITGAIADQQSALFAQGCLEAGTMKCTNGTGSFMDITIGNTCKIASGGVDNLIAWKLNDTLTYMVEGFVSVTGSAVQWLRDGLKIIRSSGEIEALAASVPDTNGVYFVPALVGLTSPHNDPSARGTIIGITRRTTDAHIARATLECIAFGIKDILDVVEKECEVKIDRINVDGGASQNNLLLQMLADYCNADVARPDTLEATALGAALMAALSINQISLEDVKHILTPDAVFHPQMDATLREERYSIWKEAVDRSLKWIKYA